MEDKSKFLAPGGQFITQALFLEPLYNINYAIYTFKEYDYEYKGNTYIALKQKYLEMEDPTEYYFAKEYFYSWKHWQGMQGNKLLTEHFDEWREELEVRLRGQAIKDIIGITAEASQGSFQAAKWLADKGWDKRKAGRPSKAEIAREENIKSKIADEFSSDVNRMSSFGVN